MEVCFIHNDVKVTHRKHHASMSFGVRQEQFGPTSSTRNQQTREIKQELLRSLV